MISDGGIASGAMDAITPAETERLADQFYAEAREDLVGLWEIVKEVEERTGPGEDAPERVLELVRTLLRRRLRAGDSPYSADGLSPLAEPGTGCGHRPDQA